MYITMYIIMYCSEEKGHDHVEYRGVCLSLGYMYVYIFNSKEQAVLYRK